MDIFTFPCFGINGKNYGFNLFLDCHPVSLKALRESGIWSFDETDTEIIGRN